MRTVFEYDFLARPTVCSGLKALETIPGELRARGVHHPVILSHESRGARIERLLAGACSDPALEIGPVCRLADEPGRGELEELLTLMKESGSDSIIALGSGTIQSVAKLLNIMYSCGLTLKEIGALPCDAYVTMPHIAVLDEYIDGWEATDRLLIDEFRFHDTSLYPDCIVIDDRVLSRADRKALASAAVITLAQSCEAYRKQVMNPITLGLTKSVYHFLSDHAGMDSPASRIALVDAAVSAQIVHSNFPPGPVMILAEMCRISRFSTGAQAASALLPYFLHQLDFSKGSAYDRLLGEMEIISGPRPWKRADEMIIDLLGRYEPYFHCGKTCSIIASMVRQSYRLMSHEDNSEVLTLIRDLVTHSSSETIMGGEL